MEGLKNKTWGELICYFIDADRENGWITDRNGKHCQLIDIVHCLVGGLGDR